MYTCIGTGMARTIYIYTDPRSAEVDAGSEYNPKVFERVLVYTYAVGSRCGRCVYIHTLGLHVYLMCVRVGVVGAVHAYRICNLICQPHV
jgi:hypothetical protein